jgi:hypothetical protein
VVERDDFLIDFGGRGNGAAYRGAGWSTAEPDETWTVGQQAVLLLPAPSRPATYVMNLNLRPMVAPPRLAAQRLVVTVNDTEIARFVIDRRTLRTCLVPWEAITGHAGLRVGFHTPDAARPSDLGLDADQRRLGLAFATMSLYPDVFEAWQTGAALSGDEPVPVDMAAIAAVERLPLHDLMLRFESLGQNCEFGLVQRQCQAEPLGLLRFSSTPLPQLLAALHARFAGMGTPGTVSVVVSGNGREYMVNDKRFGFLYHAWVKTGEMSAEDVTLRETRRVPFLVRKLLEDLEAGEKIFVFKGMGAMPEEEVFPLAMALRRYGPNTLLFVNLADADHRAGTVEARSPGFMVGYIERFAPGDNAHDLAISEWVKVCREACRLQAAASGQASQSR